MITTVTSVQRFATKTLYTRARATDGSTMLAPMSPGTGKALNAGYCWSHWPCGFSMISNEGPEVLVVMG